MNGLTIGVIFVAVWLGIALIYCVLKVCAPSLPDIFSWCCGCRLCGVQEEHPSYPFNDPNVYPSRRPQLPMIVINNGNHSDSDSDSSSDKESDGEAERLRERGPDGRKRAGGSLLLTSSNERTSRRERVLVV